MYCRYGCPGEFILHDGGSEFCNEVTEILHKKFGCEVRCTMAGRPQGNGQAEAYIKKLKSKMRYILLEDGNDSGRMKCTWDTIDVHSATFALRATVPEATGVEPAKLLLGRDVVLPNELGARTLLDPKFEGIILHNTVVTTGTQIMSESYSDWRKYCIDNSDFFYVKNLIVLNQISLTTKNKDFIIS